MNLNSKKTGYCTLVRYPFRSQKVFKSILRLRISEITVTRKESTRTPAEVRLGLRSPSSKLVIVACFGCKVI